MFGGNRNRRGSAATKHAEDMRIASTVTSFAGSLLGEVSNVINQFSRPVGGVSGLHHSPVTDGVGTSGPTAGDKFRQQCKQPPCPIGRGIPADMHESCKSQPSPPYIKHMRGLHENKIILMCGVPSFYANRFSIYLQQGDSPDPKLVAMVFDVRFKWGNPVSTNCVIRNHKDGEWDHSLEERGVPYFPFKRGRAFQIIILVDRDCYKVAVDDQHFIEFKHRVQPFSSIDTLRIDGDVKITTVQFQD